MKTTGLRQTIQDDSVLALIEIPRGSKNKYEWDEAVGGVALSRVLSEAVAYPTEYGFLPGTRAGDGDPLDVLVLIDQPTFPGCRMWVRPVGLLRMKQENEQDDKILSVPVADPLYADTRSLADVPRHRLAEIGYFFATYSALEGRTVEVQGWDEAPTAWEIIRRSLSPAPDGRRPQQRAPSRTGEHPPPAP